MSARRGADVLARLRERPAEIYHRGHRIHDVTTEPGFRNGVHSLAALYDLQWEYPGEMLFPSPASGEQVGRSFMIPRTQGRAEKHQPHDETLGRLQHGHDGPFA